MSKSALVLFDVVGLRICDVHHDFSFVLRVHDQLGGPVALLHCFEDTSLGSRKNNERLIIGLLADRLGNFQAIFIGDVVLVL